MFESVAPGVGRLGVLFVNVFALGEPGRPWLLVDAGLVGSAGLVRRAVAGRFGAGAGPEGIVLTHGHFDHVGAARVLAEGWDVPLFAHRLETPYLTGRSDYPPRDPTMGGAMAQITATTSATASENSPRTAAYPAPRAGDGFTRRVTPPGTSRSTAGQTGFCSPPTPSRP
jgi:glyoxylase-like metal-dependent hydrolase (beta-lactamase superfamily II)